MNPIFFQFTETSIQDSIQIPLQSYDTAVTADIELIIPTFLGNSQRNFYGRDAPDSLAVIWKHYLGKGETVISRKSGSRIWAGAGWTGQPLLVKERGELFLIQGSYDHNLKKIRTSDGSLVWQYAFDDVVKGTGTIGLFPDAADPAHSAIIFQGSRLGTGNFLDAKHIPSFRAISYYTGKELWRLDSKWTHSYSRDVDGSALIVNDTLYIGLENSLFTVLDPDPEKARMKDGMLQPAIIREFKLYKMEDVEGHAYNVVTESSPGLLNGKIYIASGSGRVWGYNLSSKVLDWEFYVGSDMDGSAIVTSDSNLIISVEKQYIRGLGDIMKLDPSKEGNAAVVWYFPTEDHEFVSWEGGVVGSVGINDSYADDGEPKLAAFTGIDGYLYVVDHQKISADSTVAGPDSLTQFNTPELIYKKYIGPSISTPIFVEDKLIAAGYNGVHLFRYDSLMNFKLLARFPGSFEATPVAFDHRIYIASRNGYLYCLGEK